MSRKQNIFYLCLWTIVLIASFNLMALDKEFQTLEFFEVRSVFSESVDDQFSDIGSRSFRSALLRRIHILEEEISTLKDKECEEKVNSRSIEDPKGLFVNYIYDICERYPNVEPELIMSIVEHESRYNPDAVNYNGTCVGLMQLATKWHKNRAIRLTGSSDLKDPYVNLATGIDLINDLISEHGVENLDLVLMRYNGSSDAYSRHANGNPTKYAKSVLNYMEVLKNG